MVWLFAYGLLTDPATLRRLLGFLPEGRPAQVAGYRRRYSRRHGYYYLEPDQGAGARGVAWRLPETALPLLDDFEDVDAGLYRRVPVRITLEDGREVAGYAYEGGAIAAGHAGGSA